MGADLILTNHAFGTLARQIELRDRAVPITEDQFIGVLHEHEAGYVARYRRLRDKCRNEHPFPTL